MSFLLPQSAVRYVNRYIGLSDLSPELEAQIRAEQIASILRLSPAMMGGNVIIASLIAIIYSDQPNFPYVVVWAAFISVMVANATRAWNRSRADAPRLHASQRAIRHAIVNAGLLGLVWGALPLITIFGEPHTPRHFVVAAVIVGMLCGGMFTLTAVPMAVLAFSVPIFLGSAATLLYSFTLADLFVAILLVTYWTVLAAASLSGTRAFIGRLVAIAESNERGAVIAMLLKEFEDNASDWLWSTNQDNLLEHVSERFASAAERDASELTGMAIFDLFGVAETQRHPGLARVVDHMRTQTAFRDIELPMNHNGAYRWWKLSAQPHYGKAGEFVGYRGVGSDITDQKMAEDRVAYLAHNDDLTDLANRASFTICMNEAIEQLERYDIGFAILMIDLDQFKAVNDTRGHEAGDQILVQIGRRFTAAAGKGNILARLGGDEFAVILPSPPDSDTVTELASRLIDVARQPIMIAGLPVSVGASIGIAIAPEHGTRPDQLMRNADLALYRAKQGGRNTFRMFQIEMDRLAQERRVLERQISQALEQDQFELNYQPLIDVESNRIAGFEALVRWNHPDRGTVSPGLFIPVAEQTGAIKAIGDWVLKQACKAAAAWPDDLTVSVNLSARQFENGAIVRSVKEALEESSLDAGKLEIEITESLLIDQPEDTIEMLRQLKEIGLSIAIDDFGTGYSSLSYLWKFPFDKIKLDQSFVAAIENDNVARDILRIIGSLGQTLDMRITAEGVETIEQAEFLRTIACHQLQGFYFSKPLTADDLPAFLVENLTGRIKKDARAKAGPGRKAASNE
jgi:diguanylate cyclase (GGDEF)-like protein/PAS domain S-box-containing protein